MKRLWRVSRYEFVVSMIAFAAVLLLGILNGVIVAVLASLALLIHRVARPHVAMLGRIPGTRAFSDIERNPDNTPVPGVLIFRVDAAMLYFNVEHVREAVWQMVRAAPGPLKLVVCDLSTSPQVDTAGAKMLAKLHQDLAEVGVTLRLVAAHAAVRDILRAEGLEESVGYFGRRISVADVIDEFEGRTTAATPAAKVAPA
jgi:sulfate permease, SulP family